MGGRTSTFIFSLGLLALLSGCGQDKAEPKQHSRVFVQTVQSADFAAAVTLTGDIQARVQTDLSFRVGGKIIQRMVDVGDRVTARQVLAKLDPKAGQGADPLGDLAKSRGADGSDGFQYFVQAGAFRTQSDGDAQRAKLAMMGWEARVTEREVNGRTVYRVRVGPFNKRDDADGLKGKLDGAGVDAQIVRVQR